MEKLRICTKKYIHMLTFVFVLLPTFNFNANASLSTQTLPDSSSAVYDSLSNSYWFGNLGFFGTGWTFNYVNDQIASLNSASYFGINTWHLATYGEVNSLFTNNTREAIASNFIYDYQANGTAHTGISTTINIPGLGSQTICIVGPCLDVNYIDTHWYGIYDSTTTVSDVVTIPDPNVFCGSGFPGMPPCNPTYQTVQYPAHESIDLMLREYESSLPSFYSIDSIGSSLSLDNGNILPGTDYLYGAWVVGSQSTQSAVPEPSTFFLLGAGLGGLAFWRRRSKM